MKITRPAPRPGMTLAPTVALAATFILAACGTATPPAPAPAPQATPQATVEPADDLLSLEEATALPEAAELAVAACAAMDAGNTYEDVRGSITSNIDFSITDFTPDDLLTVMLLAGCPEHL